MAKVDYKFKNTLDMIMASEWEVDNRAKWKDGTPVATKRALQVVNKYDLAEEFPIITLRPTNLKAAIDEILWIYQKFSNNIKDLNSKIWNAWADENGSIGKAYGYQIGKPMLGYDSQIDYVLQQIQINPTSRRLMLNMFNAEDSGEKALIECAYALHLSVKDGKLHGTLVQRSNDFLVANNWNLVQYAVLMHMIARHCQLEVGIFTHFIQDCHIYNKHEENAKNMLHRVPTTAPKLWVNPEVKSFYDFTVDDFELIGYEPRTQLKFEVAE